MQIGKIENVFFIVKTENYVRTERGNLLFSHLTVLLQHQRERLGYPSIAHIKIFFFITKTENYVRTERGNLLFSHLTVLLQHQRERLGTHR